MCANPAQKWISSDQLYRGAGFMQQRGRLQRTLTGADDRHSRARKILQITPLITMRNLRRRQRCKDSGSPLERTDTGSHNNSSALKLFAIIQLHFKARVVATDR